MLLICALACVPAASAPVAAADVPRPDPQVAGLQIGLRGRGIYRGAIDGLAGPLTKAAVQVLQRRAGRRASGVVDRGTRRLLGVFGRPRYGSRLLRQGMPPTTRLAKTAPGLNSKSRVSWL